MTAIFSHAYGTCIVEELIEESQTKNPADFFKWLEINKPNLRIRSEIVANVFYQLKKSSAGLYTLSSKQVTDITNTSWTSLDDKIKIVFNVHQL